MFIIKELLIFLIIRLLFISFPIKTKQHISVYIQTCLCVVEDLTSIEIILFLEEIRKSISLLYVLPSFFQV